MTISAALMMNGMMRKAKCFRIKQRTKTLVENTVSSKLGIIAAELKL